MLGFEKVEKLIERQVIEIAPLAYMRGRTLNDSFIILDEAQNTTIEQMKMFLTRIGFNSKAVITGDPSQVDLPRNVRSGLRHAMEVLGNVKEIAFTYFHAEDVVRHPVVAAIVNAYDAFEQKEREREEQEGGSLRERRGYFGRQRFAHNYGNNAAMDAAAVISSATPEAASSEAAAASDAITDEAATGATTSATPHQDSTATTD